MVAHQSHSPPKEGNARARLLFAIYLPARGRERAYESESPSVSSCIGALGDFKYRSAADGERKSQPCTVVSVTAVILLRYVTEAGAVEVRV